MPHNRFFSPEPLTTSTVTLAATEHHHLAKVMRRSHNDEIELVDGCGRLARGTILSQDRSSTVVQLTHVVMKEPRSVSIGLILGLLKQANLEFAVEKAVELGVDKIILFSADRSEKESLTKNQKERLDTIVISAVKQCGRLYLPELSLSSTLASTLQSLPLADLLYGSPDATDSLTKGSFTKDAVYMVIGPEGGFSSKEEAILKKAARPCLLNSNILRAETAAITAVALLERLFV